MLLEVTVYHMRLTNSAALTPLSDVRQPAPFGRRRFGHKVENKL
jgi:hypothetical protein